MTPFAYAVWLMPCAVQRDALQKTIDSLAARFGTPPFAPHATLCSGAWNRPETELIRRVDRLSAGLPVELSLTDWHLCALKPAAGRMLSRGKSAARPDDVLLPPGRDQRSVRYA